VPPRHFAPAPRPSQQQHRQMAKRAPRVTTATTTGRRIRGRPIEQLPREVLIRELAKALASIDNLTDTVRLHNRRWSDRLQDSDEHQ
jgi:hypothetical protein